MKKLLEKRKLLQKRYKAFTMTELLVVMAIIGILVMLVLPNNASVVAKAKSIEAQTSLSHVYSLQKAYFIQYSKYSNSLEEIGFEEMALTTENGSSNYKITIVESSSNSFKAKATAVVDFDGDGQLNEWEIDQNKSLKETVKD